MADTFRIEELRRRVLRDPASIAFAQLAEEYRRAGRYREAIEACEQGLAHHPGYLSARVTLGRSYLETNDLDAAHVELQQVLRSAPENLAALRSMAEIYQRRGELKEALAHYRTALEFARNDPELQQLVEQIEKELEPQPAPAVVGGMSFEDVKNTFLNLALPDPTPASVDVAVPPVREQLAPVALSEPPIVDAPALAAGGSMALEAATAGHVALAVDTASVLDDVSAAFAEIDLTPAFPSEEPAGVPTVPDESSVPALVEEPAATVHADAATEAHADAKPQVDALERWLESIIADRQRRS